MGHLGRCSFAAAVAAALLGAAAPAPAQVGWWNFNWPYRRIVTITDVPRSKLPGDEIGVVTMPTGGLLGAAGKDIRVTTPAGDVLAHRVLTMGPGDRVRLAFALRPGHTRYVVYFGNPKAPKPRSELAIRRGVLLESWVYAGGPLATFQQVQRCFEGSSQLVGRDFRGEIFLGFNPFGPQSRLCNLFTAHLVCPVDGDYTFATSSQDASFLLVDGKVVVSNAGRHRPQRRASQRGRVRLKTGLHELKLYHVNTGGDPVAVAAWQEPNAKRLWAIPAKAFAPIRRAQPGMLERYGQAYQADFLPVHAGESFMANQYFQRYTFAALVRGSAGSKSFRWDFGDGQTASTPECEHVYVRNGPYKVKLQVKLAGQTLTRTNRIYVTRPWHQVTVNRLDPVADHARIVAEYDFAAADPRDLGRAMALFERARMRRAILRAGDALVKRSSAPAPVLEAAVPVYADSLVAAGQVARAVAALLKAAEMTRDPAVGAALTVRAGRAALAGGDAKKAMGIFNQTVKKYSALTTHAAIREARIGIGDAWRAQGDYREALEAYQSARPVQKSSFEKSAVRKGDLARHAEDYIRRRHLSDAEDSLAKLEYEFPTEKLEGFSTLLRVRLELARRRHADAARQAEQLVRVNPRSNYAPELLLLAAGAYRNLDKPELAKRTLERIVKNYPESPLAAEARKKLAAK